MNDYTKNISSSVWSPGIYVNNYKLDTIKTKHRFKSNAVRSKFENSKYIEQPIEGFRCRVDGKIGEKYVIIEKPKKTVAIENSKRPKTADGPSRRERVIKLKKEIKSQSQQRKVLERNIHNIKY